MNFSKKLFFAFFVFTFGLFFSQKLISHTTNWFGPNANPVPEFTDAKIPEKTTFTIIGDNYFGYGDNTQSINLKAEIPLLPRKISLKVWATAIEHYSVTDEVKLKRDMELGNSGVATGDLYVQTRISLLNETKYRPAIILNSTLKTASGSSFKDRRFFNTAGYYFDTELGKSFKVNQNLLQEIRVIGNVGFFSWDVQTPGLNVQDDAVMYGLKLQLKNEKWNWENTFSGYSGWLNRGKDYGNKPVVLASRVNYTTKKATNIFLQFQKGIRFFPYNQIRLGVEFPINSLTPKFKI